MNLAESLDELNNARKQLEDSLASGAVDSVLLRRACRVILRLCGIVYAIATTLRDTRVDLQQLRGDLAGYASTLAQLRTDFDGYVSTHP